MPRSRADDYEKRRQARARRGDWSVRVVRSAEEAQELDAEEAAQSSPEDRFFKVFELSARFYGWKTTLPRQAWPVHRMTFGGNEGQEIE
ncbi:MAG: hypothetical protein ACERNK_06140 [Deltaproteobacteria bacterium]